MKITHIPTTPDDASAALDEIATLHSRPPQLDPAADLTPVLPHSGGIPGGWVTAPCTRLAATQAGVTLYVHGGGFSRSNPQLERVMACRLSQATGRPAFAVDYRLAPAHPCPAAILDLISAYRSLLDQGVPATRIILAGESSGATLLLSALLMLKQASTPLPGGAVAVSPITDLTLTSPSITTNDGKDILDRTMLHQIRADYLAGADPGRSPQSPLHGDLRELPPLLLAVGSHEILLDDAQRLAQAASAAGVSCQLDIYDGMPHAFHATALPAAATLLRRISEWAQTFSASAG